MKAKNSFKWSCAIILIMMVLSVLLSSCLNGNSPSKTTSETPPRTIVDNRPAGYGNTPANICNTPGQFAQDENYVYYFSEDDKGAPGLYKSNFDFKETRLIGNISGSSLNVLNGCLYYVNEEDNNTIYKMDTDGQNNQQISGFKSVLKVMAIDDKLYFILEIVESDGIYVMDTDGNNLKKVTDVCVYNIYIFDNVIYFTGQAENNETGIYKININGTRQTLLLSSKYGMNDLLAYDGYVYYSIMNYNIFKVSVNGGDAEMMVPLDENNVGDIWGTINICENTIYYSTAKLTSMGTHSLNLDTKEDKQLTPDFPGKVANHIYILNNQIYFSESQNDNTNYYSMDLDGSNMKKLW